MPVGLLMIFSNKFTGKLQWNVSGLWSWLVYGNQVVLLRQNLNFSIAFGQHTVFM